MRAAVAVFALIFSLVACADEKATPQTYKEGTHYVVLDNPVRTRNPDKIEVTEVFWYGCGHCFRFEPLVHAWQQELPDDVEFRKSPAMWNDVMEVHARAFYTAKALKVFDEAHKALFDALNLEGKTLATEAALADFFTRFGVEKETFRKAFGSFGVTSQVKQADARARSYQITGTPEIVVDGKYRISARMAGGHQQMLNVAEFLIDKIRAERD